MSRSTGKKVKVILMGIVLFESSLATLGSKRKLANIAESSVNAPPVDADSFLQTIEAEVDAAIASIKEGTHKELLKRAEALNRAKENKIAAADRHRKMQIKNINAQYEYEVEDAGSLYNVSYSI